MSAGFFKNFFGGAGTGGIGIDDFVSFLVNNMADGCRPDSNEHLMRGLDLENEIDSASFRSVFDKEIFYLRVWATEVVVKIAFGRSSVLEKTILSSFYAQLSTHNMRIQNSSISSLIKDGKAYESRTERYYEAFSQGEDYMAIGKVPMWVYDFILREGLDISGRDALDWLGRHGGAYDGMGAYIGAHIATLLGEINSSKKHYNFI